MRQKEREKARPSGFGFSCDRYFKWVSASLFGLFFSRQAGTGLEERKPARVLRRLEFSEVSNAVEIGTRSASIKNCSLRAELRR